MRAFLKRFTTFSLALAIGVDSSTAAGSRRASPLILAPPSVECFQAQALASVDVFARQVGSKSARQDRHDVSEQARLTRPDPAADTIPVFTWGHRPDRTFREFVPAWAWAADVVSRLRHKFSDNAAGGPEDTAPPTIKTFVREEFPLLVARLEQGTRLDLTTAHRWARTCQAFDPALAVSITGWFQRIAQGDQPGALEAWESFSNRLRDRTGLVCRLYVPMDAAGNPAGVSAFLGEILPARRRHFVSRQSGHRVTVDVARPLWRGARYPAAEATPSNDYIWMDQTELVTPAQERRILSEEMQHIFDAIHPLTVVFDPLRGPMPVTLQIQRAYFTEMAAWLVVLCDPELPESDTVSELLTWSRTHDPDAHERHLRTGGAIDELSMRRAAAYGAVDQLIYRSPALHTEDAISRFGRTGRYDQRHHDDLRDYLAAQGAAATHQLSRAIYEGHFGPDRGMWTDEFEEVDAVTPMEPELPQGARTVRQALGQVARFYSAMQDAARNEVRDGVADTLETVAARAPFGSRLTILGMGLGQDIRAGLLEQERFGKVDLVDLNTAAIKVALQREGIDGRPPRYRVLHTDLSMLSEKLYDAVDQIMKSSASPEQAIQALAQLVETGHWSGRPVPRLGDFPRDLPAGQSGLVISTDVIRHLTEYFYDACDILLRTRFSDHPGVKQMLRKNPDFIRAAAELNRIVRERHLQLIERLLAPRGKALLTSDIGLVKADRLLEWRSLQWSVQDLFSKLYEFIRSDMGMAADVDPFFEEFLAECAHTAEAQTPFDFYMPLLHRLAGVTALAVEAFMLDGKTTQQGVFVFHGVQLGKSARQEVIPSHTPFASLRFSA